MSITYIYQTKLMQENNKLDLAIIIVSYNVADYILKCINSLVKDLSGSEIIYEIVIIDNNSNDNSVIDIKCHYPNIKLIENIKNIGFGRAQNIGIKTVLANNYLILNPDTIITNKIVEKLYTHKVKYGPAVVGCRMLDEHTNIQKRVTTLPRLLVTISSIINVKRIFNNRYAIFLLNIIKHINIVNDYFFDSEDSEDSESYRSVESVSGSCFLIDGEKIKNIDGYDENIFLYYEDDDLFKRTLNNNWEIHLVNDTGVIHYVEKSSEGNKEILYLHKRWSILYYYRKHGMLFQYNTMRLLLLIMSLLPLIINKLLTKDKKQGFIHKNVFLFSLLGVDIFDPFNSIYNSVVNVSEQNHEIT